MAFSRRLRVAEDSIFARDGQRPSLVVAVGDCHKQSSSTKEDAVIVIVIVAVVFTTNVAILVSACYSVLDILCGRFSWSQKNYSKNGMTSELCMRIQFGRRRYFPVLPQAPENLIGVYPRMGDDSRRE